MNYGGATINDGAYSNTIPYSPHDPQGSSGIGPPPPPDYATAVNVPTTQEHIEDFKKIPINELQQIPGYNEATFDSMATAPPADLNRNYTPPTERNQLLSIPNMTEEQAREAVLDFASEKCCYGTKPAKELIVKDITYNSAFHYTLETFCEKRETARAFKPYKGTPISVGYAPLPWEVSAHPKEAFKNEVQIIEIPNTEEIRICHICAGVGQKCCTRCMGAGSVCCSWCNGSGHRHRHGESEHHHSHCHHCHGNGRDRCFTCMGNGHVTCQTCKGKTQLRFFIELTVTWTNHVEDHISDTNDFPKELIREVSGQIALDERYPKVWPVTQFPDASVNMASQRIISKHEISFPMERVLEQRQRIRIVPIAAVEYKWQETHGRFHVYGFESKVHFPDYPQTCCWGCNII